MLKYYPILLMMLSIHIGYAQQKDLIRIIHKDTINITGYVFFENGKPAPGVSITSLNKELRHNHFELNAVTDSTGYFKLNGARMNDTLRLSSIFTNTKYPNRGARYMLITIPNFRVTDLFPDKPVAITAVRKAKRQATVFKVSVYKEPQNEAFITYHQIPDYPGGLNAVNRVIRAHLNYPEKAVNANIEGTSQIRFTIFKDGRLGNYKIVKGIGYGCDEMVINALKQLARWSPAKYFGHAIEVDYTLSIEFKLTDK